MDTIIDNIGSTGDVHSTNLPKILLILSRFPCPPIGGDRLKNYNLLKILSKHYHVYLVVVTHEQLNEQIESFIQKHTKSYKIFIKPKYKFLFNSFKSIKNDLPLQVNYYYFKDVQGYIDRIEKRFDLIYCTLIRTTKYVENKKIPKILEIADSVGLNYKNSIHKTRSIFWKYIYKYEKDKLLAYEKKSIENFDKTLFFNREEMKYFNGKAKTEWIPHGVNAELLTYQKVNNRYKDYVAFFGKMDVQHNIDAVLWFCENVLDYLDRGIKFVVVGAYPKKVIWELPKKYHNVEVTNLVADPYKILKSCICVVAPMQTGGGIQNKILESMALGTIVITTTFSTVAIEGARDRVQFLVEDDPEKMATIVNNIFENNKKFDYIKTNAREFIKKNFTWNVYENRLLSVIANTFASGNKNTKQFYSAKVRAV